MREVLVAEEIHFARCGYNISLQQVVATLEISDLLYLHLSHLSSSLLVL